ncbi:MAG: YIEGIA domain-containing protein, partial [Halanaerobiaceae bacterium]
VLTGILIAFFLPRLLKGEKVANIAHVEIGPLKIEGHNIGIGKNIIMNVGEEEALQKWRKEGLGIKIIPRDEDARATLFNLGQRQAILHDLSILMGVKLDQGLQQYTPLARLEINRGTLHVIIIPQEPDKRFIREAINKIPVLESTRRKPLLSAAGNKAAD